jgi:hypothetical protein
MLPVFLKQLCASKWQIGALMDGQASELSTRGRIPVAHHSCPLFLPEIQLPSALFVRLNELGDMSAISAKQLIDRTKLAVDQGTQCQDLMVWN